MLPQGIEFGLQAHHRPSTKHSRRNKKSKSKPKPKSKDSNSNTKVRPSSPSHLTSSDNCDNANAEPAPKQKQKHKQKPKPKPTLLTLPGELRNQIYKLCSLALIPLSKDPATTQVRLGLYSLRQPAFTLANKQTQREGLAVFFATMSFSISFLSSTTSTIALPTIPKWPSLAAIDPRTLHWMRRVDADPGVASSARIRDLKVTTALGHDYVYFGLYCYANGDVFADMQTRTKSTALGDRMRDFREEIELWAERRVAENKEGDDKAMAGLGVENVLMLEEILVRMAFGLWCPRFPRRRRSWPKRWF